jgi:hypothetical protein
LGDCLLWAVFLRITEVCGPNFRATFVHGKSYVLIFSTNDLGYISGDFLIKVINLVTLGVAANFFIGL